MVYSNSRKLNLSGWLKANSLKEYCAPLKLQKFLFLYEASAKADNLPADFSHLRGYQRGPVFSNVWGDYTKDRAGFDAAASREFLSSREPIDYERAKKAAFLVRTLSEAELSDLTHHMNIWQSKKDRIMRGELQVTLEEEDFNEPDRLFIRSLMNLYPSSLADNSSIIELNNKFFVFNQSDASKLTEQQYDVLAMLSEEAELINPVFVTIGEGGCLIVD